MADLQKVTSDTQAIDLVKEGELVLAYRPYAGVEKWVKYKFSNWSSFKAWFAFGLVVLFFGFNGPGLILELITKNLLGMAVAAGGASLSGGASTATSYVLPALFCAFGAVLSAIGLRYISHPTHVSLSPTGVCLEWHRWKLSHGLMLPWEKIDRIDMAWPPGKTSPQDCVIRFKGVEGSLYKEDYPIQLKLGSIATVEERHDLLRAIELWGGNVPRDPQLQDVLTPPQDHSYTELWLQALSAPPKRERLTPLAPGAVLLDGKYQILGQLGVGGQGTAYLATSVLDADEVVLKEFILPVYVDVNVRRKALENMQNEATMLRRLDNTRVVRLMEFFVEDHRGYLVLEKIDGKSLRGVVDAEGAMSEARVRELAAQMTLILTYLHGLTPPVVHRDFTPDNLILGKDGILKLVDFNVAQQTESTATGTVVGKHAYLPPEQFRGKPVPQSDIYAMGATLYYLLIGHDPEPITCSHPTLVRQDVSTELDKIIARATALDTVKRYARIEELAADLGITQDSPTLAIGGPQHS